MRKEPIWLRTDVVLAFQQSQIADHGGMPGLRDHSLLEATVARPQQLFAYENPAPTLSRLAAACGYGIIRNHPFVDGNKRTGLVAIGSFLELNGQELLTSPTEMYQTIVATAAGELSEDQLIAWVGRRTR